MTNRRIDPAGGWPARSEGLTKGLQHPKHTKKTGALQSDWKRRALRAYRSGILSLYECERIFRAHFETFTGGAR